MFNNKPEQLSFLHLYSHIKLSALSSPKSFLGLCEKFFDLSQSIPESFYKAKLTTNTLVNTETFPLENPCFLSFLHPKILKLNTITQLRAILFESYELRTFCNFEKVLSISTFSRFRKLFALEIEKLFNNIRIYAHNIAYEHYPEAASTLIFGTTGLEPKVRENNPKLFQFSLKKNFSSSP